MQRHVLRNPLTSPPSFFLAPLFYLFMIISLFSIYFQRRSLSISSLNPYSRSRLQSILLNLLPSFRPLEMEGQFPTPPGPVIGGGDWRAELQDESRERIVDKIMEVLKRNLPFSGQDGLNELKKIAIRFEEKTYAAATSKSDYLRKVSLKLLTMETKSHNPMVNCLRSNAASNSINFQNPALPLSLLNPPRHLEMDSNNWLWTAQGQVPMPPGQVIDSNTVVSGSSDGGDWRAQLQHDSRERIVSNITETLKRHLPISGPEGLRELKKIALRFEEKIYTAATSESDYLTKVSLKLSTMEAKSGNRMAHSLQSAAASNR